VSSLFELIFRFGFEYISKDIHGLSLPYQDVIFECFGRKHVSIELYLTIVEN